jgi:hypothetical protein
VNYLDITKGAEEMKKGHGSGLVGEKRGGGEGDHVSSSTAERGSDDDAEDTTAATGSWLFAATNELDMPVGTGASYEGSRDGSGGASAKCGNDTRHSPGRERWVREERGGGGRVSNERVCGSTRIGGRVVMALTCIVEPLPGTKLPRA